MHQKVVILLGNVSKYYFKKQLLFYQFCVIMVLDF